MLYGRTRLAIAVLLLSAACSRGDDDRTRRDADIGPVATTPAPIPSVDETLPPGDVRIVTTDGGVDLALIGDTISTGLSPQALAKVRQETDTAKVHGTGFGAEIEKMVKGTVQGAIGTRVVFPISEVREVRYDGEKLVFEWAGTPRKLFDQTKVNGKPLLASFAPDDARRFADAVNARKGKVKHI